jgi:hypothetical protein
MPGNPQPLIITIPTYRQKLLYDIYDSTRCVLSFDPAKWELIPHHWYVTMASRIYQPCIVATGRLERVPVYLLANCASIVKFTSTLGQDVYVPCLNRSIENQCLRKQRYT